MIQMKKKRKMNKRIKQIKLLDNIDINNEEIDLIHIYKLLIDNNIIKNNKELDILYEWNNLIKDI